MGHTRKPRYIVRKSVRGGESQDSPPMPLGQARQLRHDLRRDNDETGVRFTVHRYYNARERAKLVAFKLKQAALHRKAS